MGCYCNKGCYKGLRSCQEDSWDGDLQGQEIKTIVAFTMGLCWEGARQVQHEQYKAKNLSKGN